MKLRRISKKSPKKLVQLQNYKYYYKNRPFDDKIDAIKVKTVIFDMLNLIYKFNKINKRILFLGFPDKFSRDLKSTNHISVPNYLWFHGLLSKNSIRIETNSRNKKKPKTVFTSTSGLKKKPDLVVVSCSKEPQTVIEESYAARLPLILINEKLSILLNKTTPSKSRQEETAIIRFIYSLLNSVIYKQKRRNPEK